MPYAPDLSGTALDDRYELHALIGEGAFGRVYQGRDRRLARPVAVKVIKPWWTEDPEWVATFEREAQLLARVSDPGIVQIFDVGNAREGLYYVSELVDGENLAGRLSRGAVPAWEACGIAAQLCRALAHAHGQRIVHRDIKPANILLSRSGRVKVGDFGLARLAEGSTDGAAATIVGTPKYMAPEQGRGLPTTPATDVYSVGVVLYEMLAGAPPFSEDSVVALALRHVQDPPPPLSVRLPTSLVEIVGCALAKDPARRYADGAEMADALVAARREASGRQRARVVRGRTRVVHGPAARAPAARAVVPSGTGDRTVATAVATLDPPRGSAVRDAPAWDAPARNAPAREAPPRDAPARDASVRDAPARDASRALDKPAAPASPPPRRPAPPDPDATRPAPPTFPRRNVNPPARRRAIAALGLAFLLLTVMAVAAVLLAAPARTRVPSLTGLKRSAAAARARSRHVHALFTRRYDAAAAGTVISQLPNAGTQVATGTAMHVTLSRGPAPVQVPLVVQENSAYAQTTLQRYGLRSTVTYVAAPGIAAGTVTSSLPHAGMSAPAHSTVALFAAETPRWRPLTTVTGASSVPFEIRGQHWRVVYKMAYQGTCTLIFFCSGPSAQVLDARRGSTVAAFDLESGSGKTRTFSSGPGVYELKVTPGSDDTRWVIEVEDDY